MVVLVVVVPMLAVELLQAIMPNSMLGLLLVLILFLYL